MSSSQEESGSSPAKKSKVEAAPTTTSAGDNQPAAVQDLWIAVDIEKTGPDLDHILAVGVCLGRSDGTIIEKRAFCGKVPPKEEFDQDCWLNFWVKHPGPLARVDAESTIDHMGDLYIWINGVHKKYGPFGRGVAGVRNKFRWLSDNPAYDIGLINMLFEKKYCVKRTLAEMFDSYVPTDDPTERQHGLTKRQSELVETFITAPHDHYPANDAAQIFQRACAFRVVKEATTVHELPPLSNDISFGLWRYGHMGDNVQGPEAIDDIYHHLGFAAGDQIIRIDMEKIAQARAKFTVPAN